MNHAADIEEAGCTQFEATLGLMDGILTGAAKGEAEAHATRCPLCGPMVAEWAPLSAALVNHFEDRAELAKPALAQMPDRVFAVIDSKNAASKRAPGFFARLAAKLHMTQAQLGFVAAAAAVAMIVVPVAKTGTNGPVASPSPSPSATPLASAKVEESRGSHVDQLAFDGASGTVYTTDDNTLVIWVTEADGA